MKRTSLIEIQKRKLKKGDLPTSPGLTKPVLTLRHGTDAAVFIILGASTTITGDPISSLDFFTFAGSSDSVDSHLTFTAFGLRL